MSRTSVQIPILIGFSLILLILGVVIAANISQIHNFSTQIRTIVLERNQKSELAAYMKRLQRSRYRSLLYASALEDPFERDEELRYFHSLAGDFIKARDKFTLLPLDRDEASMWNAIRSDVQQIRSESVIVLDHLEGNRLELARRLIKTRIAPIQERLMDSWSRLVDKQSEKNKGDLVETDRLESEIKRLSLLLGAFALLVGVIVAYVALRISRHLEDTLRQEKDRAQLVLESISEAVIRLNAKGEICYLNPYAEHTLGIKLDYDPACKSGNELQLVDKLTRESFTEVLLEDLRRGIRVSFPPNTCLISSEGMEYDVEGGGTPLIGREHLMGAVIVFRDVTENLEALRKNTGRGRIDLITGLSDSMALESRLADALQGQRAKDHPLAFLRIQILNLDEIRQTLGTTARDILMRQIASQLQTRIRETDVLASMNDNSFGILLITCPEPKAAHIASHIRDSLAHYQLHWEDHSHPILFQVGMVQIPPFAGTLTECLEAASHADTLR